MDVTRSSASESLAESNILKAKSSAEVDLILHDDRIPGRDLDKVLAYLWSNVGNQESLIALLIKQLLLSHSEGIKLIMDKGIGSDSVTGYSAMLSVNKTFWRSGNIVLIFDGAPTIDNAHRLKEA